jgi:flagellin
MFNVTAGTGASGIAYQLGQNNRNLQRSLERLSTMRRINSPADDPGGLAVSTRLGASLRRTEAALTQINSTQSFLQTQDGVMEVASRVLIRMDELASIASSGIVDSNAASLYSAEFTGLQSYLGSLLSEEFNGMNLFMDSGTTTPSSTTNPATVSLTGQTIGISTLDLGSVDNLIGAGSGVTIADTTAAAAASVAISSAINNLATLRATNGSEQSRVGFASELLATNKLNLEAANSRIVDLDFASELVNYTRFGILDQQNVALMAQANMRAERTFQLLFMN